MLAGTQGAVTEGQGGGPGRSQPPPCVRDPRGAGAGGHVFSAALPQQPRGVSADVTPAPELRDSFFAETAVLTAGNGCWEGLTSAPPSAHPPPRSPAGRQGDTAEAAGVNPSRDLTAPTSHAHPYANMAMPARWRARATRRQLLAGPRLRSEAVPAPQPSEPGQARRPSKLTLRRAGSIKGSLRLSRLGVVCYSARLTDTVAEDRALSIQLIYKNIY